MQHRNLKLVKPLHPIQRRCKELGITQKELAHRLGVSEKTIGNWVSGRIRLNSCDLSSITLRKTLGVDKDYFHR
jgi:transcriptional regulator with XRE-family HTH domain